MSVNRLISETKQSAKQCLSQTPTAILAVNIKKVYMWWRHSVIQDVWLEKRSCCGWRG